MSGEPDATAGAHRPRQRYAVAICTYNGERFVDAQLSSIFAARPACDELIVIDDASSDGTLQVVAHALEGRDCRTVVAANSVNLGSRRSFERALQLATEPVVFLADQDDLWRPDKSARMLDEFARRPALLLLHSDARIVDNDAKPLGYTLMRAIEVTGAERNAIRHGDAFDSFVRRNVATGATIALRRSLLDIALPIPDGWVHDEWLATIASAIGEVDFIDAPLIDYRQHGANQIGARRLSLRNKVVKAFAERGDYYTRQLTRTESLLERLTDLGATVAPDRLVKVRAKLAHLRVRAALPRTRIARLPSIAREWLAGNYQCYSTGFKSVVRDALHSA